MVGIPTNMIQGCDEVRHKVSVAATVPQATALHRRRGPGDLRAITTTLDHRLRMVTKIGER